MLIDRLSLSAFHRHLERGNTKQVLTEAIIDLLSELNFSSEATQPQALYGFSSLFLYIQAFATNKDIDGQQICEWLLSRPFLSPFCLLAICNHISPQLYLFNLLVPRAFTGEASSSERALEIVRESYLMADLSLPDSGVNLAQVVKSLPQILANHFLSKNSTEDVCELTDDASYIVNFHLCGASLYDQMRKLYAAAQERQLSPVVVASLNGLLMTSLMTLLSRLFRDEEQASPITSELCSLYALISSMVLRVCSDQTLSKLFDNSGQPFSNERLLKTFVCYFRFAMHSKCAFRWVFPYALEASRIGDAHAVLSRFVAARVLSAKPVRLSGQLLNALGRCRDIGILLDFLWFTTTRYIEISDELRLLEDFRSQLVRRLPFRFSRHEIVGVESRRFGSFSGVNREVLEAVSALYLKSDRFDLGRFKHATWAEANKHLLLLRILCQTDKFTADPRFRDQIRDSISVMAETQTILLGSGEGDSQNPWQFRVKDAVLPVLHFFLDRSIGESSFDRKGDPKLKRNIPDHPLKIWEPLLSSDPFCLSWLTRFVVLHYSKFNVPWRQGLFEVFSAISGPFGTADVTMIIKELINAEEKPFRDPETLRSPYSSKHDMILDSGTCALLLRGKTVAEIILDIETTIFAPIAPWDDRAVASQFACEIAVALPYHLGMEFFNMLLEHTASPLAVPMGQLFLTFAHIDLFHDLCFKAAGLIDGNAARLDFFVRAMMGAFLRLTASPVVAAELIITWIKHVHLNPDILDSIEFVYALLGVQSEKDKIMAAVRDFVPKELQDWIVLRFSG
jgi:hypothetical protein